MLRRASGAQEVLERANRVVEEADEPPYTGPPRTTWEQLYRNWAEERKRAAL